MSKIRDGEDLWQWSRLELRLNTFRRSTITTKTIDNHHHHHHHHHHRHHHHHHHHHHQQQEICQYLPPTPIKLIKSNDSFRVLITYLQQFKFHTSFKILLLSTLTLPKGPGVPKESNRDLRDPGVSRVLEVPLVRWIPWILDLTSSPCRQWIYFTVTVITTGVSRGSKVSWDWVPLLHHAFVKHKLINFDWVVNKLIDHFLLINYLNILLIGVFSQENIDGGYIKNPSF